MDCRRAIVLVDLDCFYAQVEQARLGVPRNEPLAVIQWDLIVAVNYAARPFGVKRGDNRQSAVAKCPDLLVVHVDTLKGEVELNRHRNQERKGHTFVAEAEPGPNATERPLDPDAMPGAWVPPHSAKPAAPPAEQPGPSGSMAALPQGSVEAEGTPPALSQLESPGDVISPAVAEGRKRTWLQREYVSMEKVSLERYREASFKIFEVFRRYCNVLERASVDEAYFDLTATVNGRIRDLCCALGLDGVDDSSSTPEMDLVALLQDQSVAESQGVSWQGHVIDLKEGQEGAAEAREKTWRPPATVGDLRLMICSQIVAEVRQTVFKELDYTCSAGIGHNKMLAKLIASTDKPNGQTVICAKESFEYMKSVPVRKIKFLGGKLGKALMKRSILTAGELQERSLQDLKRLFGEKSGVWLYEICRGRDTDAVVERDRPMSLCAAKAFPPVGNMTAIQSILGVLADELSQRLKNDFKRYSRTPRSLSLSISVNRRPRTVTGAMPNDQSPEQLVKTCMALIERRITHAPGQDRVSVLPCNRLAISAFNFPQDQTTNPKESTGTITRFFKKGAPGSTAMTYTQPASAAISRPNKAEDEPSEVLTPRGTITALFSKIAAERTTYQPPDLVASDDSQGGDAPSQLECRECGVTLSREVMAEHKDYHLAVKLQAEFEKAEALEAQRKKKAAKAAKRTIASYFAPKKG